MAKYDYWKGNTNQQWYFKLTDNNGKTILMCSEGYVTEQGCLNDINSCKAHSGDEKNYESFNGTNGQYYFRLKASNGQIIGKSEGYATAANRDAGKENCKREGPGANPNKL